MPFDEDECFYGIGLVMTDIHDEILDFARGVEQWEIYRAKRRKAKSEKPTGSSDSR